MATNKIAIVDYGMGNIGSVANALEFLGGNYFIAGSSKELERADAYILPGVGAFPAAMENLLKHGLADLLTEEVTIRKKPFLGICLGMQLIALDSVEQEGAAGLGWIDGHVVALEPYDNLRVPHVGWNNLSVVPGQELFQGIDAEAHFFFDHCFFLQCSKELVIASSDHGISFVAAIREGNIFATQFHPEKSQRSGLKLLRNFLNYIEKN